MGSLLIDQRGRYDVRRSTSVALIGCLLLNYGTHLLVPDLATACDTWFLKTDSSAVLQNRSNPVSQTEGARYSEIGEGTANAWDRPFPIRSHAAI
jgi:hypothetical protein